MMGSEGFSAGLSCSLVTSVTIQPGDASVAAYLPATAS